ncbi:MAG: transposase, partial [Alkaliphilus sp.]|nr:transposase [Alkaliphilus sp.]
ELLQHTVEGNKITVVAYCLMDNHVHLLLHSGLQEMSETFKWINIKFAGRYNHKYKRVGHVFQDRFKSEIIGTEEYLIQALRYIHNNPVKAKVVSDVSAYEWSSYNSYTSASGSNVLVDTTEKQIILGLFQGSIEQFEAFHLKEDDCEFLEIEEDLEKVAKAFDIRPFDIYFLGGAACILGQYTERATRDFDFIDLNYPSALGRVFVQLRDFDMLEYESTVVSPKYKERAIKLNKFEYLNVYLLSPEDIIVSKIIRLEQKDIEDIDKLIEIADRKLINQIVDEVLSRNDLYESKRGLFVKKLSQFRGGYDV